MRSWQEISAFGKCWKFSHRFSLEINPCRNCTLIWTMENLKSFPHQPNKVRLMKFKKRFKNNQIVLERFNELPQLSEFPSLRLIWIPKCLQTKHRIHIIAFWRASQWLDYAMMGERLCRIVFIMIRVGLAKSCWSLLWVDLICSSCYFFWGKPILFRGNFEIIAFR